jgi:alpha-mannosidase
MTNGLLSVDIDTATGTWAIDGLAGFGRLVDDGDAGDTYNHCPPDVDQVVDEPAGVSVERL